MINVSVLPLLLAVLTRWLDRQDRDVIRYLIEENRVLRQQLQGRRLQLNKSHAPASDGRLPFHYPAEFGQCTGRRYRLAAR